MTTNTYKYAVAVVLAAFVAAAAAPPAAEACGFYSDEDAAKYAARWMFAHRAGTPVADLARQYPELDREELAMLTGGEKVRVRTVTIDNEKATALVEVTRAGSTRLYEVKLVETFVQSWSPTSVEPASAGKQRALAVLASLESFSRQLVTAASARLARR